MQQTPKESLKDMSVSDQELLNTILQDTSAETVAEEMRQKETKGDINDLNHDHFRWAKDRLLELMNRYDCPSEIKRGVPYIEHPEDNYGTEDFAQALHAVAKKMRDALRQDQ